MLNLKKLINSYAFLTQAIFGSDITARTCHKRTIKCHRERDNIPSSPEGRGIWGLIDSWHLN